MIYEKTNMQVLCLFCAARKLRVRLFNLCICFAFVCLCVCLFGGVLRHTCATLKLNIDARPNFTTQAPR